MSQAAPFIITPSADLLAQHSYLKGMADSLGSAYANRLLVEEQQLQVVGQALWDALSVGNALDTAKQTAFERLCSSSGHISFI